MLQRLLEQRRGFWNLRFRWHPGSERLILVAPKDDPRPSLAYIAWCIRHQQYIHHWRR